MKAGIFVMAAVLLAAGITGWRWYSFQPPQVSLSITEQTKVDNLLQGMTPRCVGRYMVNLPAGFITTPRRLMASINKSPVRYQRLYRPAFEQKIRLREAELKTSETLNPQDQPFLKQVYSLPEGMEGVIYERNEGHSVPDVARILEAHLYTNGVAVEITMKADNGQGERYAERRKLYPEIYGNTVPQRLAELIALLKRISGRNEADIPVVPGFCLPELFIADSGNSQGESVSLSYGIENYPALSLYFDTDNTSPQGDSLLERSAIMKRNIKAADGRTIASGRRELNGLYAEQWLAEGNSGEQKGDKVLRFVVNIHEKTVGPKTPRLSVSFIQRGLTGEGRLSENEAVSLWQTITDTLRMRPGAY